MNCDNKPSRERNIEHLAEIPFFIIQRRLNPTAHLFFKYGAKMAAQHTAAAAAVAVMVVIVLPSSRLRPLLTCSLHSPQLCRIDPPCPVDYKVLSHDVTLELQCL